MGQPSPKEFQPYRRVQRDTEQELRRILEVTAKAIERRVATLRPGVGGQVRAAQLKLTLAAVNRLLQTMWVGRINPLVARAIEDSLKASEDAIETMTRVAYAGLPEAAAQTLVDALRASAQSGLKSDAARRKRELSRRVYRQRALDDGKVEETIRSGLIAGLSAKELAADVYRYVSPKAPGGSSYAAQRLARTEINNAFHERQVEGAKRPGVKAVKWNLSGSHKVPDECNVYASHGGKGEWSPTEIPDKPHPQCFCYLTYITLPPEEFRAKLEAGGFDDEIERRTRENMARLGQKVGKIEIQSVPAEPPVSEHVLRRKKLSRRGGYIPKKWKRESGVEREIASMVKALKATNAENQRKQEAENGPDWAEKFARSIIGDITEDTDVVYTNGPHTIRFTGKLDHSRHAEFLEDFDYMQERFPMGHDMRINIGPEKTFGKGVGGETTLGTGSMYLNETVMDREVWPGMPISNKVSAMRYVLAHEWGHAVSPQEEANQKHVHNEACSAGGMTRYGTTGVDGVRNPAEGYAESFAEWALTGGKTNNPAALEYARHFNWRDRFGLD